MSAGVMIGLPVLQSLNTICSADAAVSTTEIMMHVCRSHDRAANAAEPLLLLAPPAAAAAVTDNKLPGQEPVSGQLQQSRALMMEHSLYEFGFLDREDLATCVRTFACTTDISSLILYQHWKAKIHTNEASLLAVLHIF